MVGGKGRESIMDLGLLVEGFQEGKEDEDNLRLRLPPVRILPDAPQTQLTVLKSEPCQTCPHGLVRYLEPCERCWEQLQRDAYGWVLDSRLDPWRPEGTLCVHQLVVKNCDTCWGRGICDHRKERRYCCLCGGAKLCITCRKHIVPYVGTTCKTCQARLEGRQLRRGPKKKRDNHGAFSLLEKVKAELEAEDKEEKQRQQASGGEAPPRVTQWYARASQEKRLRERLLKALADAKKEAEGPAVGASI